MLDTKGVSDRFDVCASLRHRAKNIMQAQDGRLSLRSSDSGPNGSRARFAPAFPNRLTSIGTLIGMDLHALALKVGKGLLMGVGPSILSDIRSVYAWTQQDTKTFWQMFDWRVSVKNLIAGAIGGVAGVFGFSLVGVDL